MTLLTAFILTAGSLTKYLVRAGLPEIAGHGATYTPSTRRIDINGYIDTYIKHKT